MLCCVLCVNLFSMVGYPSRPEGVALLRPLRHRRHDQGDEGVQGSALALLQVSQRVQQARRGNQTLPHTLPQSTDNLPDTDQ